MNRAELQEALRRAGVPDDLYALPGIRKAERGLESYYLLEDRSGAFIVAIFERGQEHRGPAFDSEAEACQWLYDEIVFDAPPPHALAPDEEQRAKERAEVTIRDVTALVRHAEQVANATTIPYMLGEGLTVDQFGQESGTYLCPNGTPFEQRSLPPSVLSSRESKFPHNYHRYEIIRRFRVRAGVSAPAFGQPGGGIQFKAESGFFAENPRLLSIMWLLRNGYLRRIASS